MLVHKTFELINFKIIEILSIDKFSKVWFYHFYSTLLGETLDREFPFLDAGLNVCS